MHRERQTSLPWWLWPHLLSLDAPLVAVGWQLWWSCLEGVKLSWFHHAILALGVWMVYLADRLADGWRSVPGELETERHVFAVRRRAEMGVLLGVAVAGLAVLSPLHLTGRQLAGGILLLAATGGYFANIHGRRKRRGIAPKEAGVGVIFAAGTSFFVLGAMRSRPMGVFLLEVTIFGVLCFLNCALITKWERNPQDQRDPSSLLNAFPRLTASLGGICAALAGTTAAGALASRSTLALALAPLVLGALGLWGLDRSAFSTRALRVLADAVLLTPWVFLLFVRWA
jgi:hypothetical protein